MNLVQLQQMIQSKVETLNYEASKCRVTCKGVEPLIIEFRREYREGFGDIHSFAFMKWLSAVIGTDDISSGGTNEWDGCETCDHGSGQTFEYECKNADVSE